MGGEGDDIRPEPGLGVDEVYEQLLRSKRDIIDSTAAAKDDADGCRTALEYIDVMLIHQPRPGPEGRARAWEALGRAKAEGWVKEIGVSNLYVQSRLQLIRIGRGDGTLYPIRYIQPDTAPLRRSLALTRVHV